MGALPRSASSSDMRYPLATVIVTEPPPNEAENNLLGFDWLMQEADSFKLGHRAPSASPLSEPGAVAPPPPPTLWWSLRKAFSSRLQ